MTPNNAPSKRPSIRVWAVALWLIVWQAAAMLVGRDFLLASPVTVAQRFFALAVTAGFWKSAAFSLVRILMGYLLGVIFGVVCASLAARYRRVRELIAPLWIVLRAIPVASFVIVALIWMPSKNLSALIVFLIIFPLIYSAALTEIERADPKMIEMARVFRMSPWKKIVYVYALPAIPAFSGVCASAMGLAWKSGAAAELIAIPTGSIGEKLYSAKVYLMTGDLFAWTLLILLLSALCARLVTLLLSLLRRRIEGR